MRSRVNLYSQSVSRGPAHLIACTEDALNVGHAEYANDTGEAFWTLPYNHWVNSQLQPQNTHIQIQRQTNSQAPWKTVGWHMVADHDATDSDAVYTADDYLSLLGDSMTEVETAYTEQELGSVLSAEAGLAIAAGGADSKLGFVTVGHIDASGQTSTLSSAYQSRLAFMAATVRMCRTGTQRPIMSVAFDRTLTGVPPFTFDFRINRGVDRPEIPLVYGDKINGFREIGGYGTMATRLKAVAQSLTGSAIMFSQQDAIPSASYGLIESAVVYSGVPDQGSLDRMTLADAKLRAQTNRDLALSIRSGALAPYDGYEIGDSFPVTIKRGKVYLEQEWYTLWGLEWKAYPDGSEQLSLALLPKMT